MNAPIVTFRTAIRDALDEELAADERVILFGEDVAVGGGVLATTTRHNQKKTPPRGEQLMDKYALFYYIFPALAGSGRMAQKQLSLVRHLQFLVYRFHLGR